MIFFKIIWGVGLDFLKIRVEMSRVCHNMYMCVCVSVFIHIYTRAYMYTGIPYQKLYLQLTASKPSRRGCQR